MHPLQQRPSPRGPPPSCPPPCAARRCAALRAAHRGSWPWHLVAPRTSPAPQSPALRVAPARHSTRLLTRTNPASMVGKRAGWAAHCLPLKGAARPVHREAQLLGRASLCPRPARWSHDCSTGGRRSAARCQAVVPRRAPGCTLSRVSPRCTTSALRSAARGWSRGGGTEGALFSA